MSIPYEERAKEHELNVKLFCAVKPATPYEIVLLLQPPDGPVKQMRELSSDRCTFKFVPVPATDADHSLRITAAFDEGSVTGRVADEVIKIGGQPHSLSEVSEINLPPDASPTSVSGDGQSLPGTVEGLDGLAVSLGNTKLKLDALRARRISIAAWTHPIATLGYTIDVKLRDKPAGHADGIIELSGAPGSAVGPFGPPVPVQGNLKWQTVAKVKRGQLLILKASGKWCAWKDGGAGYIIDANGLQQPQAPGIRLFTNICSEGTLIGRVGDGEPFVVGKSAQIRVPADGDLQLRMNKEDVYLYDCKGELSVTLARG